MLCFMCEDFIDSSRDVSSLNSLTAKLLFGERMNLVFALLFSKVYRSSFPNSAVGSRGEGRAISSP